MSFRIQHPLVQGINAEVTNTTTYATSNIPVPLGLHAQGIDYNSTGTNYIGAGVFQYARGSDVTAAGQFVQLQGNSAVKLAVANSASYFPIGVACGALSATNVYGWVQVAGPVASVPLYASGTSFAAGGNLYINADTDSGSGYVQAAAVNGNLVLGACVVASADTDATALGVIQLNYPGIAGVSASI